MARSLEDALESLGQHVRKDKEKGRQTQKKPPTGEIVQLPLWPEPARGLPNSTLRGALFPAIQGKTRDYKKREILVAQKGIQIRFTGWQLDQADLDVWEQCLHLARQHPLGTRCDFTARSFLKALGRSTGKQNHEWLKDAFARLVGAVVEITHNDKTYFGTLIEGGVRDERTGLYVLNLNPDLVKLYGPGMWTAVDWDQRRALGTRKPLAQWLIGFYSTHAKPYPMSVKNLMQLSGSRTKKTWKFKQNLEAALDELKAVGAIVEYSIEDGTVHVSRTPSKSQKRHLIRARPRKK